MNMTDTTMTFTHAQLAAAFYDTPLTDYSYEKDPEFAQSLAEGLATTIMAKLREQGAPEQPAEPVSPARALLADHRAYSPGDREHQSLSLAAIAHSVTDLSEALVAMAAAEAEATAKVPGPRPTRAALLAFAADVVACRPDDIGDPSSYDTEALDGLADHAAQLIAGQETVYDRAATAGTEQSYKSGFTCAGCRQDAGNSAHPMDKPVRDEFAYLCDRCHAVTAGLLARIKQIEEPDGGWSGGDTVQLLCEWFTDTLGYDIEGREGTQWEDDKDDT